MRDGHHNKSDKPTPDQAPRRADHAPALPDLRDHAGGSPAHDAVDMPRVLIAVASRVERESLTAKLTRRGMVVEPVSTPAEAIAAIATERFDLAMVQQAMGRGRGLELVRSLHELDGGLGVVMLARKASLDDAVCAMREGVLDFVVGTIDTAALTARVERAIDRARFDRRQHERATTPTTGSAALTTPLPPHADSDADLLTAYHDLAEQMASVGLTAEFNSLIRQELDLESLLRTVLEFVLAKLGPTNAAIFLPSTTGDYSLGAYVNYDCPRDTAEVLLDHLASVVPERFEDEPHAVLMRSEQALFERFDNHADWLDGHAVACLSCRHDDECLAVLTFFRDRRTGFSDEHVTMLDAISSLFAEQLARVIHIHHRHLPKDQWAFDAHDAHDAHDPHDADGADDYESNDSDTPDQDAWDDGADDFGLAA
ncbi:MAG: response regulator [Planctomycetota bacterium]|nr:response regulator [Planctomycetota bacterium]